MLWKCIPVLKYALGDGKIGDIVLPRYKMMTQIFRVDETQKKLWI
jgi:hypothetical protein